MIRRRFVDPSSWPPLAAAHIKLWNFPIILTTPITSYPHPLHPLFSTPQEKTRRRMSDATFYYPHRFKSLGIHHSHISSIMVLLLLLPLLFTYCDFQYRTRPPIIFWIISSGVAIKMLFMSYYQLRPLRKNNSMGEIVKFYRDVSDFMIGSPINLFSFIWVVFFLFNLHVCMYVYFDYTFVKWRT